MPGLKILSGDEVIEIFEKFGFSIDSQKGSHAKLKRITKNNIKQTITVPRHKELDRGTVKAVYNQALMYISEDDLRSYFYAGN